MTALQTRLSEAREGSRELDELVALATTHPYGVGVADWDGFPAYTTSVNHALALAERVLPGQARAVGDMAFDPPGKPWAVIWTKGGDPKFNVNAATPALALCLAVLRATQEQPDV